MTLDELVDAIEGHCREMAPFVAALATSPDRAVGGLARMLDAGDRELDRLCHELIEHTDGRYQHERSPQPWT
jgi:hypothetical protein